MRPASQPDLYSCHEIALAAGVSDADVVAIAGAAREFVPHDEAVRVGRLLAGRPRPSPVADVVERRIPRSTGVPFAVSSTLHAGVVALLLFATFDLTPRAATFRRDDRPSDLVRLVFLASPGPGGGGGGGGLLQKAPAPRAMREGHRAISSPLPRRAEPPPVVPAPKPPESRREPPLDSEPLPAVAAPIVTAPADARSRIGELTKTTAANDSHGAGVGGGAGTGKGTGLGDGNGTGIGSGSGGGTGGGPYRPGGGIDPPRLLREVKADYTEDARQRSIAGDVVLEIVVRRDGSVGDIRVLQGLGGGLNDRAVQAVRQWQFSPAHRQNATVDVIVEVAVEFKLR